jgi:hypothetical protein
MQIIIVLTIIIFLFFVISSFESGSLFEIYSQEDLVIDEKVDITISKDNKTLIIPAKIGIDPKLWNDHSFDNYSVYPNHTSPLTTNNYNGTIHIKSSRDRDFSLENFLDVWGFDKSRIKNVFCDGKEKCNINVTLTDGQPVKLQIKNEEPPHNFSKYASTRITFDYPSKWNLTNESTLSSAEYLKGGKTLRNSIFLTLIEIFPNESKYMTTPFFSILINKLDSNKTKLDQYYKNNIPKLVEANANTFPHFIGYNETEINGNQAYLIFLNTTLVAEPGSSAKGNNITQNELHIWTLKDGYFYDISFKAFENIYNNYYPIIDKIIKSIRLQWCC